QQTATSEILRAMSSSPTNLQPVLDTIARDAALVCGATDGVVHLVEGGELPVVAHYGLVGGIHAGPIRRFPLTSGSVVGRAVIEGRTIHIEDSSTIDETEFPLAKQIVRQTGHRTGLAVPLLREGNAIGALAIRRLEVRPFTEKQIALLQTFADQAVIAIENVRLFTELQSRNRELTESLEQQTATSEVLQVISRSPSDVEPTFEVIAARATRLCEAVEGTVFRFDGALIHIAAHCGGDPEQTDALKRTFPISPGRGSVTARAILTRAVVHVPGAAADPEHEYSALLTRNLRTVLSVPMLRNADPIGAITVRRQNVRPFSDKQIALLQTFADQAVIAIENVRLFNETKEALERQTATTEILKVITSSFKDMRPVFEAIVDSAVMICDAAFGALFRYDGQLITIGALSSHVGADERTILEQIFPTP